MKQVILDTNFILTCIKQKIDLFEELRFEGFQVVVPKQVIKELENLSKNKEQAKFALSLLRANRPKLIDLKGKTVDKAIINYTKSHKDVVIATLDKEIKDKISNNKIIIRGKKKLEVM
jgi:rRNA-processing protein FCF1